MDDGLSEARFASEEEGEAILMPLPSPFLLCAILAVHNSRHLLFFCVLPADFDARIARFDEEEADRHGRTHVSTLGKVCFQARKSHPRNART